MISPFDCVAAQDMGMADAERKVLHRHCERSEARLILPRQRVMTPVMSNSPATDRNPHV
jgi:hypothetical protein